MGKIKIYLLNLFFGKLNSQNFFGFLYKISLEGMNIGSGSNFRTSGEANIVKEIASKYLNNKSIIIFDVGANIGNYSKLLHKFFPEDSKIYSFEPSLTTFAELKKNVKSIHNIIPINSGLSDKNEHRLLYKDKEKSGLASVYKRNLDHLGIDLGLKEKVDLITLDQFCRERKITRINFLKIDAEGHELNILKGATEMLNEKRVDYIQFEFGGCNIDSKTFLQDFYRIFGKNYSIYRIVKDGIYNLGSYKESNECFVTTNYLAKLN